MAEWLLDLACGHQRTFATTGKKPPFLAPSKAAWSLSWCTTCGSSQKVLDVRRHFDGSGDA